MKLTTMTQVTVDGVMQGNGHATDEERRNGFERGGWAMGVFENERPAPRMPRSAATRSSFADAETGGLAAFKAASST
jgi:hypothetical protein